MKPLSCGALLVALAGLLLITAAGVALATPPTNGADIFRSTNLLHLFIEIDQEGLQALRASTPARNSQPKPKGVATVTEGTSLYTNVTVQLKGFTSFQSIDGLPSLTLNFAKLAPGQRFHGLTKISLNNSLQDPTRLHEKLSRELFAAAGVPVPRADHALVTLNGRDLGVYVLTEGFGGEFLRHHFERADGTLYEAGVLQDIHQSLTISEGRNPTNNSAVNRLLAACREPDAKTRLLAVDAALDLEKFLSMVAVEALLCHSDSYSMNRNNYRVYHDPASDKVVFIPHGMDRVLGTHRSPLDLDVVPPLLGMVARAVLTTAAGRRRYVERASALFTNLFEPDRLCQRARDIDTKIAEEKAKRSTRRGSGNRRTQDSSRDVAELCLRIAKRAAELQAQFANLAELMALVPTPTFDSNGVAHVTTWCLRPKADQSGSICAVKADDGRQLIQLRSPQPRLHLLLRASFSLPAGSYRLTGQLRHTMEVKTNTVLNLAFIRSSGNRFDLERRRLNPQSVEYRINVPAHRAPEEFQIICAVESEAAEVTLDVSTLRLVRESE